MAKTESAHCPRGLEKSADFLVKSKTDYAVYSWSYPLFSITATDWPRVGL
jgi:hypothetical protein